METALKAIGQYGFPIVMCLLIYVDLRKKVNSMNGAVTKMDNHITNHVVTGLKNIEKAIEKQTELLERKLK